MRLFLFLLTTFAGLSAATLSFGLMFNGAPMYMPGLSAAFAAAFLISALFIMAGESL